MSFVRPLTAVVVDASSMLEALSGNPDWIDRLDAWLDADAMLLAPTHFRVEAANGLLKGMRLDAAEVVSRLQQLFAAGVQQAERGLDGLYDSVELAAKHDLTVCDAAYLQLALDVDGELATCDRALARAARAEGVAVIG